MTDTTGKMIEVLLPCPFCGGDAVHRPESSPSPGYWVKCTGCGVSSDDRMSRESAAKLWNSRPAPLTTQAGKEGDANAGSADRRERLDSITPSPRLDGNCLLKEHEVPCQSDFSTPTVDGAAKWNRRAALRSQPAMGLSGYERARIESVRDYCLSLRERHQHSAADCIGGLLAIIDRLTGRSEG